MANKFELFKKIFGKFYVNIVDNEALNADAELEETVTDLFEGLGDARGFLTADIAPFLLEENTEELVANHLKENADEIAKYLVADALRFLRHPRNFKPLRKFEKYFYEIAEDADWFSIKEDLCGDKDAEIEDFPLKLQKAFDEMSSDKIKAVLAVRYGKDLADKNDPAVIALYNAAMEDLKAAIQ